MDLKKTEDKHEQVDHGIALQRYLDTIPLTSIPSIKNSPGTAIYYIYIHINSLFDLVEFYNTDP